VALCALAWAVGACCIVTLVGVTYVSGHLNSRFGAALDRGGLAGLVDTVAASSALVTVLVGGILAVPYFVFGVAITYLFESSPAREYHRLYFADLLGAAVGCIVCVVALETGGYSGALMVVLAAPFLAAGAFAPPAGRGLQWASGAAAAAAVAVAWMPGTLAFLEPTPERSQLSRDYDRHYDVREEWHTWNSFVRVSLLDLRKQGNGDGFVTYALGNGTGWARLRAYEPEHAGGPDRLAAAPTGLARLAMALEPERSLVIFAGAGSDMIQMDGLCGGRCEITGVELNRQLVEDALSRESYGLRRFLARPGLELVVAEGREYLERDGRLYNSILLSWSGASFAHYVGTAGHTTQYLYTREAFESLLDHLAPGGILIVANTNKAQQILTLRSIFEDRGWTDLAESLLVLRPRDNGTIETRWDRIWDENRLVVKPGGFHPQELARIEAALEVDHSIVYGPGSADPEFAIYRRLVETEDVPSVVSEVAQERKLLLRVPTDDRPFALDMTPRSLLRERGFWFPDTPPPRGAPWALLRKSTLFLSGAAVAAALLIVGPLLLRGGPRRSRRNVQHLLFFLSIGTGFMLVEVGLVQKLGLLLGNPGLSMAVVLASVILSTGLGSLASERAFARGLSFSRVVWLLLGLLGLTLLGLDAGVSMLLPLPVELKSVAVAAALFPLGFLMGQLFPQGLRRLQAEGEGLVPWAWAVNGASSTVAAGLGVALAPAFGFSAVVLAGAAAYALILALPPYRGAAPVG